MPSSLLTRFAALPAARIEDALLLRSGTLADFALLAEHHYKARRPATATRVLVLEHLCPTAMDRFLVRPATGQVVGVLVESLPALSCRLRDYALGGRYTSARPGERRGRIRMLNDEVRVISRVVVHPQWRGLGLAVRLVRAALASATTPYTEALAAMGHVSPFFARAGMTAYHRPAHEGDARLAAALRHAGFAAVDLARLEATWQRIQRLAVDRRQFLLTELARWHRAHAGRSQRRQPTDPDLREQLRAAQERLLCEPVYYLYAKQRVGDWGLVDGGVERVART